MDLLHDATGITGAIQEIPRNTHIWGTGSGAFLEVDTIRKRGPALQGNLAACRTWAKCVSRQRNAGVLEILLRLAV